MIGPDDIVSENIINILEIAGAEIFSEINLKCDLPPDIGLTVPLLGKSLCKPDYVILTGTYHKNVQNVVNAENARFKFIDSVILNDINVIVIENDNELLEKYKKEKITTIGNLDSAFGQISLILSIEKDLKGNFGSFNISEKLLPN